MFKIKFKLILVQNKVSTIRMSGMEEQILWSERANRRNTRTTDKIKKHSINDRGFTNKNQVVSINERKTQNWFG